MLNQVIHSRLDKAGIGIALLCALHCSLLPLIITSLPLWGLGFLANPYWEFAIIGTSFVIGCYSLSNGYKRTRLVGPILILASGFVFIYCAQFLVNERYEWLFMVAGGLQIAAAHLKNWKALHKLSQKPACCEDNQCQAG